MVAGILGGLSLGIVEISWDSDDSRFDWLSEVSFGDFLHLGEDHGGDLLSLEFLLFTLVLNNNGWFSISTSLDLEWPELDILLDGVVGELSTDESLGIEDSV